MTKKKPSSVTRREVEATTLGGRYGHAVNKGGRPIGSGNPFRHEHGDVHQIVRDYYGPVAYKIAQVRRAHIEKGCHLCMKEAEDRLYGRPPQEIKHTGEKQPPLILMGVADRVTVTRVRVSDQTRAGLAEPDIEGEVVEIEGSAP
jgi:hypothetical protein